MTEDELLQRTKQFGLTILRLVDKLPNTVAGRAIAGQLVRCGTLVGANYRAACRARSKREFVAKLGVVEEEADESAYWLELLAESRLLDPAALRPLYAEAQAIRKIMARSRMTATTRK